MGYVYIIDPGFSIDGTAIVKIGTTKRHPSKRVRELQTGNPNKIHLIDYFEFPDAVYAERRIHSQLSQFRVVQGGGAEFFAIAPTDAKRLVQDFAYKYSKTEANRRFNEDIDKFVHDLVWPYFKRILAFLWLFVIAWLFLNEMGFSPGALSKNIELSHVMGLIFLLIVLAFLAIPIMLLVGFLLLAIMNRWAHCQYVEKIDKHKKILRQRYPASTL
jgi:uncharacterized membrane protein